MVSAITFVVLFIIVQVVSSAAALLFSNLDKLGSGTALSQLSIAPVTTGVCLLVGEGLLAFGLWWWFFRVERPIRQMHGEDASLMRAFRLKPLKRELPSAPISLWKSTVAVVAALVLSISLGGMLENLGVESNFALFEGMKHSPLCWLLLAIVGPLCEEMVFRVGVLRSLYRQNVPSWAAIVVSAAVFAIVHGNWAQSIPAFVVGAAFGMMYVRTGNLRLCLPAHILNNTLALLLMFWSVEGLSLPNVLLCVLMSLSLLALAVVLYKK